MLQYVARLGTNRGEVEGALEYLDGHTRNTQGAGACSQYISGNAKVDAQVKVDIRCVAADGVVGIHSSGAKGRGKGDAWDGEKFVRHKKREIVALSHADGASYTTGPIVQNARLTCQLRHASKRSAAQTGAPCPPRLLADRVCRMQ